MALQYFRRQKRYLYLFLWIVIGAFIILYIPAFTDQRGGQGTGQTLGRVGDQEITVSEFQRAYAEMRARLQGQINEATLRQLNLEEQVFQGLVSERLMALEARRLGINVDDAAVAREIQKLPGLKENGRFIGTDEYRRRVEANGRNVEHFENVFRNELLRRRLEAMITDGVMVSSAEVEEDYRQNEEQVKAEYVVADVQRFQDVTATDDEVRAHFEKNRAAYRIPERRVVSYVLVDTNALRPRVTVTDGQIEAYYKDHGEEYLQPEQVCASHILVKVKAAPEAEGRPDAEAKKIAEGLLDQLHKGADFATLAKKASEDKGSASKGGDLDCFGRGSMVPEFDAAVFEMTPGTTSELVKSTYGYHIIRLNSRREETTQPLAQVKEMIRHTLLNQGAQTQAERKAEAIAAALAHGANLENAARDAGLTVEKTKPFSRDEQVDPLHDPAAVSRVFSLRQGETKPEPIAVPRGRVFLSVVEVQASRDAELKDVQDKVKADVLKDKRLQRALALAADLRTRAERDGLEKAAKALELTRKEMPALSGRTGFPSDLGTGKAVVAAAFGTPEKALSAPVRTEAGYVVLRPLERKAFDPVKFEAEKASIEQRLKERKKQELFQAYMKQLRERYPLERNMEAYRRVASR